MQKREITSALIGAQVQNNTRANQKPRATAAPDVKCACAQLTDDTIDS